MNGERAERRQVRVRGVRVVAVADEPCGCEPCDLVCCGVLMVQMMPKTNLKKKPKRK